MVFLCRHGLKLFENGDLKSNLAHVDAPLADGLDIVRQKKFLTGIRLIVCSPYLRCRQTAEIISDGKIPIIVDSDLREYVRWDRDFPPMVDESTEYYIPGVELVETKREIVERVKHFCSKKEYFQDDIMVVSHAMILKYIGRRMFGKKISFEMGMFVSIIHHPTDERNDLSPLQLSDLQLS